MSRLDEYARAKGIKLEVNSAVSGCQVRGQYDALKTALLNVIQNAIKYTDCGSINISITASDKMLDVCVEDTGVGISSSCIETVFERTWQCEDTDPRLASKGIGLHPCKQILEQYGGSVTCRRRLLKV